MITFDEIKTLIGTEDGRVFYKLIDKIHSVEVAKAIIFLLIEQKCLSFIRAEVISKQNQKKEKEWIELDLLKWIEEGLFDTDETRIRASLLNYDAFDVLDAWDEEKKNNDTKGN